MRFDGKTVLITGATGGFGRHTATSFAGLGARLVLGDLKAGPLAALAKSIGPDVITLAGDVRDPGYHRALVAMGCDHFGGLDCAVNNAGILQPLGRVPDIDPAAAQNVIDVNLMGVYFALQAQLPVIVEQFERSGTGGAIVNIASAAGLMGSPFLAIYAAAKHGVVGLTRSAAAEYARKGVRVNAVCPAFANTNMLAGYLDTAPSGRDAAEHALTRGVPMGRIAQVDEVVQAILFAADPKNSFMTGETLSVDGGLAAV